MAAIRHVKLAGIAKRKIDMRVDVMRLFKCGGNGVSEQARIVAWLMG